MFNPLYLTTSRHGVFYLRFPIPQNLHPERLQSNIKLSLGTRCPKEALHLGRGLCYVGESILSHMKAAFMDYYAIREFLKQFFAEKLEALRQRIGQKGQFSAYDVATFQRNREIAEHVMKEKDFYFSIIRICGTKNALRRSRRDCRIVLDLRAKQPNAISQIIIAISRLASSI